GYGRRNALRYAGCQDGVRPPADSSWPPSKVTDCERPEGCGNLAVEGPSLEAKNGARGRRFTASDQFLRDPSTADPAASNTNAPQEGTIMNGLLGLAMNIETRPITPSSQNISGCFRESHICSISPRSSRQLMMAIAQAMPTEILRTI